MAEGDEPTSRDESGASPLVGGRFEVVEPLGAGGAGNVFRVVDHEQGDAAALKVAHDLTLSDERLRDRFVREAELLEGIDHPGVLSLRAWSGRSAPRPWMATDYCPGGSLVDHIHAEGPPSAHMAADWALQILDALEHLHGLGMLHRDIKPDNMLLDAHGCAVLADFGVARKPASRATQGGDVFGTPAFMAPEQFADATKAEPRSDLYGVGATLFTLVTQRPCDQLLVARDAALARLPVPLQPVVDRATQPRADDRYPTAAAMAGDLADALEQLPD